jgi:hypothetical protein
MNFSRKKIQIFPTKNHYFFNWSLMFPLSNFMFLARKWLQGGRAPSPKRSLAGRSLLWLAQWRVQVLGWRAPQMLQVIFCCLFVVIVFVIINYVILLLISV